MFLERVKPILSDLGLAQGQVAPLLGFPQGSASKRYFKANKELRERLYLETCDYMSSTQRFQFVWY